MHINSMLLPLVVVLAVSATVSGRGTKSVITFGNKEIGTYYVNVNRLSWTDAYAECKAGGNGLAILDTEGEAELLKENLQMYGITEIHLGFHDQFTEGVYKTITGELVELNPLCSSISDWETDKPTGGSTLNCGGFSLAGITDTDCGELRMSVCEASGRKGYDIIEGFGSYKFHSGYFTWPVASDTCVSEGAHLLLLESQAEVDALVAKYPQLTAEGSSETVWLGLHRMFGEDIVVTEKDEDSDSEDEFLLNIAARGRRAKNIRPRKDNFNEWNEEEFFRRYRLTKPTVLQLLALIEDQLETATDRSVSPMNKLLLTLRFYSLGTMLVSVGDFAGVHKCTAGKIVKLVSNAISNLAPRFIHFPTTDEEKREMQAQFFAMHHFPRVLAAIDCTHCRMQSAGGDDAEVFRNRKNWFSLNVQTCSDPQMRIMDIVARWPGSAHDQNIFNNSSIKARLEAGEFGNAVILGDSGYGVKPYLITPLRNPVLPHEHLFNESQIRTRGIVERQYGTWKRRFPILSLGMRVAIPTMQDIIVACAVLHNMAIDAKEELPPADPDCCLVDVDVEPLGPDVPQHYHAQGNNNGAVQRELVEYFRQLL